jgi:hypothetical protein
MGDADLLPGNSHVQTRIHKIAGLVGSSIARGMSGGLFSLASPLPLADSNRDGREKSAAQGRGLRVDHS